MVDDILSGFPHSVGNLARLMDEFKEEAFENESFFLNELTEEQRVGFGREIADVYERAFETAALQYAKRKVKEMRKWKCPHCGCDEFDFHKEGCKELGQ